MKNAFEYTASGQLMDDAKCYAGVRELHWPDGVWSERLVSPSDKSSPNPFDFNFGKLGLEFQSEESYSISNTSN